jgi:tetratricopeptide (TPR) repeat protein
MDAIKQVHVGLVKLRGPEHPHTLNVLNNLAVVSRDAGQLPQALPLFEEAATAVRKGQFQLSGAGNILSNTVQAYEAAQQWAKAEAWRRAWLEHLKHKGEADSPAYASELLGLGQNLLSQRKWADAENTLRECLAIRTKKQPDDWRTFNSMSALGEALLNQQKFMEAEPLLVKGYEGMKQRADKMPPKFKSARLREGLERLIKHYETAGKTADTAPWRKELEALKVAPPASSR